MSARGYTAAIGAVAVAIIVVLAWPYRDRIDSADALALVSAVLLAAAAIMVFRLFLGSARHPRIHDDQRAAAVHAAALGDPSPKASASQSVALPDAPITKPFYLGTGSGFTVAIVGESYRQTALRAISD